GRQAIFSAPAGVLAQLRSGFALPPSRQHPRDSHPVRRWTLTLIVARQSSNNRDWMQSALAHTIVPAVVIGKPGKPKIAGAVRQASKRRAPPEETGLDSQWAKRISTKRQNAKTIAAMNRDIASFLF
ncbi:MAG: hypothetical protein ACR650_11620, partial [Methylocystis sp.]